MRLLQMRWEMRKHLIENRTPVAANRLRQTSRSNIPLYTRSLCKWPAHSCSCCRLFPHTSKGLPTYTFAAFSTRMRHLKSHLFVRACERARHCAIASLQCRGSAPDFYLMSVVHEITPALGCVEEVLSTGRGLPSDSSATLPITPLSSLEWCELLTCKLVGSAAAGQAS